MIYFRNGNEIKGQFTIENGTTYPGNWLMNASSGDLAGLGITTYTEVFPTITTYQYYLSSYIDNSSALTRTYDIATTASRTITVTGNYTVPSDKDVVITDATSGNIVVTLPAVAISRDRDLSIKKLDSTSHTVTIQANGAELIWNITSANTLLLTAQGSAIPIHCDGTAWYVNQ